MLRQEIRAFIEAGVDTITPSVRFNSGRITELNSKRSNQYPYVWLESLSRTGLPNSGFSWLINIHIAKKDKPGSKPEEYEAIVDECDLIAQQLMPQYKLLLEGSGYTNLTLEDGEICDPFIHRHADDTTGVILSFNIQDFSPTDVC